MTDHEMLKAAAQAAGINAEWHTDYNKESEAAHEGMWLRGERSPGNSKYWNPLRDDGDALRLAVTLRLRVEFGTTDAVYVGDGPGISFDTITPEYATRRAIVRAAAAMAAAPGLGAA